MIIELIIWILVLLTILLVMRCFSKIIKNTKDIFGTPEPKNISSSHSSAITILQNPQMPHPQIGRPHIPKAHVPHPARNPEIPHPQMLHMADPKMPYLQMPDLDMPIRGMPYLQMLRMADPQMPDPQMPPKVLHSPKAKQITVVVEMNPLPQTTPRTTWTPPGTPPGTPWTPRTTPLLQSSSHPPTTPDTNDRSWKKVGTFAQETSKKYPGRKILVARRRKTETPVQKCRLFRRLYHYTDETGYKAILKTRMVKMSTGRDAICGPGVYLTSLPPNGSFTKLQIAQNNYDKIYAQKICKVVKFFFF